MHMYKQSSFVSNPFSCVFMKMPRVSCSALIPVLLLCLAPVSLSHAGNQMGNETGPNTASAAEPKPYAAYVSVMGGAGRTEGLGSDGLRNFEIRFGATLAGEQYPRLDFVHFNEGHPNDNHRDGFAVQASVGKQLGNSFRLEAGAGPYLSMDTTSINGTEYDNKRAGLLGSAAVLYMIGNSGFHVRAGINAAYVIDGPHSTSILIGLGKEFDSLQTSSSPDFAHDEGWDFGVLAGIYKTNHGGIKDTYGYQAELRKRMGPHWAWSLCWIEEGDDHVLVDRSGLAAKAWYMIPLNQRWTASVATGPYLAENRNQYNHTELNGIISLQLERRLGSGWKLFGRFERIVTSNKDRDYDLIYSDRDVGMIGFSREFGK